MPTSFLSLPQTPEREYPIDLPARGGMARSVHVIDERSVHAVNAALATGRPLLVRGEPGTGKSQLARAAAEALGRAFVTHVVDARTETRDLMWSLDAVARLAEAQVMGSIREITQEEVKKKIDVSNFIAPGPLWWALDWDSAERQAERAGVSKPATPKGWTKREGVVVLVDEIDKADSAIPNGLLDALGHGRFDVLGRSDPVAQNDEQTPLVVITTNEERALPDAFLRRCLVLHLGLPNDPNKLEALLIRRGKAHFSECDEEVIKKAAGLLIKDREVIKRRDLSPPGLAETIDLIRAVTEQCKGKGVKEQLALLDQVAEFALRKHPPEQMR